MLSNVPRSFKDTTPGASRGGGGVVIFLQHELYKNSVSFVEAGMGMEGQIMCTEH